jgi:hypothetical protein
MARISGKVAVQRDFVSPHHLEAETRLYIDVGRIVGLRLRAGHNEKIWSLFRV